MKSLSTFQEQNCLFVIYDVQLTRSSYFLNELGQSILEHDELGVKKSHILCGRYIAFPEKTNLSCTKVKVTIKLGRDYPCSPRQ